MFYYSCLSCSFNGCLNSSFVIVIVIRDGAYATKYGALICLLTL